MRTAAAVLAVLLVAAAPLGAQSRGRYGTRSQGVPPGQLPPPGQCRVWYDHRPPGQQPPPTSCREAERVASRDPYARVIYGSSRDERDDRRWDPNDRRDRENDRRDREDDRRGDRPRAVPRDTYPDRYPDRYPYPNRYPYPGDRDVDRDGYGYSSVPFDNGYKDGFDKGREDARDGDRFDPMRHSRYRSGDRGYNSRYGSKEQYKNVYRDGFRAGYEDGYAGGDRYDRDSNRRSWPW